MQHVDEGRLHAWLDGELPADEARALERHLDECAACRATVEEERGIRDAASAILRGADPGQLPRPGVIPLPVSPAAGRRLARPWVTLGWAASVLVALGVGWLAGPRRPQEVAVVPTAPAPQRPVVRPTAPADPVSAPAAPVETGSPAAPVPAPESPRPMRAPTPANESMEEWGGTSPIEDVAGEQVRTTSRNEAPIAPQDVAARSVPVAEAPPPPSAPPPPPPPPAPAIPSAPPTSAPLAARVAGATTRARSARESAEPQSAVAAKAEAAPVTVRGVVRGTDGRALAGVSVQVPGVGARTLTGADGGYVLSLPAERLAQRESVAVVASVIGRASQSRALAAVPGSAPRLDFALAQSALALEGVIVTAAETTGGGVDPSPRGWRPVEDDEATTHLGRAPVTVARLPVDRLEIGEVGRRAAVRVTQRLAGGEELTLVQSRDPSVRSRVCRPARVSTSQGISRTTLRAHGLIIDASAPIRADSLRAALADLGC